jgi:gentisate 1,2-dioxygenase
MHDLGRLEDLPADYLKALSEQNLIPLWPTLLALLPPNKPRPHTKAAYWSYQALRPLLLRAGELTPIEKAERRVLVLANPGHGLTKLQATPAIYLGLQLLLPGERAPTHRHTPNAVRMIVEGEGAYTTVEGVKCPMFRGDLILTPTGLWHEHGHDGTDPVVWLDVLDLPLVYYLEASYHINGESQTVVRSGGASDLPYVGLLPTPLFEREVKDHPMLRYAWSEARASLQALALAQPHLEAVQIGYVNPATGTDIQNILGYYALMLRPSQTLILPARSPASIFHVIEGDVECRVEDQTFSLAEADTCCVPGYVGVVLRNRSAASPAFIFIADEAPLHRKLGLFENRGRTPPGSTTERTEGLA